MNRLSRLPALIIYLSMLNCALVFLFSSLWGNSLFGKVEAGHYYLGNHGVYTEVVHPLYLLSWLQDILFLASLPVGLVALLIYWAGVGSERNDKAMHAIYLGRPFDLVEGLFSLLFDSWRKPDLKFFTPLTSAECLQKLLTLPGWIARDSYKKKPLDLTRGDRHFDISRYLWADWNGWGTPIVLHGRLHATPHGTYLKAWYRLSSTNLLFFSIFAMVGLIDLLSGIEWLLVKIAGASQAAVVDFLGPVRPVWSRGSLVIGALLVILISRHGDLARLVKEVLTTDSLAHPTRSDRDIRQLT